MDVIKSKMKNIQYVKKDNKKKKIGKMMVSKCGEIMFMIENMKLKIR